MANNRLIFLSGDSDPRASYALFDEKNNDFINMQDPLVLPWLKLSKWNETTTLFTIMGLKTNGGFDGTVEYRFIDTTTGVSLIKDLDGNYQGELFISTNTLNIDISAVTELGVFTSGSGDHNLATNDKVWFSTVPEVPELSSTEWTVTVVNPTQFTLQETWTFPSVLTLLTSAQLFNMSTTETAVDRAPILIKESLT